MAVDETWTLPGEERAQPPFADGLVDDVPVDDVPVAEVNARLPQLHQEQVADFVRALRDGDEPAVTRREVMRSLGLVTAAYESARTGRAVSLEPSSRPDPSRRCLLPLHCGLDRRSP